MSRSITRIAAIIGTVAVSGSLLAACGGSSGDSDGLLSSIESGNVTLGTKFDQPGLGLREPDGSMTGLDVEVATYVVNSIAAENGWEEPSIDWRETPRSEEHTSELQSRG